MAIAAFIIVGALLVSSTLIASMLLQRRAELASRRRSASAGAPADADNEPDEYTARLRRSLRSRLSHELRTPLNSIITLSQMMMDGEAGALSKEQRRYCEVIRRNGRNLLALVDQIGTGSTAATGAPAGAALEAGSAAAGAPEPVEATPAEEDAAGAAPAPAEPPSPPGPVLLIEDDPLERQRVGSFIESAGYDVTRAASGEEGLALLRSRPFAAVVLDLIMPEMTGLDVLRAARTEERLADVRFIVLSAMYMTKNERQVLGPRVADVVRKGETMARALTFALHRAVTPAHPELQPHDGGGRHA
ncbi:MAG TPA: response regulator [Polyangia bacterium]|jgi:CheY-like chemotaxis protein